MSIFFIKYFFILKKPKTYPYSFHYFFQKKILKLIWSDLDRSIRFYFVNIVFNSTENIIVYANI